MVDRPPTAKQRVKQVVLPTGRTVRRLPLGIGRGLRMGVDFQRGETRLFLGLYEIELNRHLRAIARPGYRSFDIGGQYGYDALVLAKLTGAPVVSVEVDPLLAAEIEENAAANPGLPTVTVEAGFVGADDDDGRVTIDALAERHFVPDLVKMDIEGAEYTVLPDMLAAGVTPTQLLIEFHHRWREVGAGRTRAMLRLLRKHGYRVAHVATKGRELTLVRS